MKLIYLDACVIIEAREKQTPEAQAIVDVITQEIRQATPFVTSGLSLLEVLVHPLQDLANRSVPDGEQTSRSDRDWYHANLSETGLVRTAPVTRCVLVQAALLRATIPSLRTPDAIHAATAYQLGCAYFVTGDPRLSRGLARDESGRDRLTFVPLEVDPLNALRGALQP